MAASRGPGPQKACREGSECVKVSDPRDCRRSQACRREANAPKTPKTSKPHAVSCPSLSCSIPQRPRRRTPDGYHKYAKKGGLPLPSWPPLGLKAAAYPKQFGLRGSRAKAHEGRQREDRPISALGCRPISKSMFQSPGEPLEALI